MRTQLSLLLAVLAGLSVATPLGHLRQRSLHRREVPQEHSHNFILDMTREFLNLDNPKGIFDPVFGLLGNAAAAAGAGDVSNLDCLKQETADQAFTNAKAAGDIGGMAAALMFQAIERNTGGVGVRSALCTETPANPEIGAFGQHQDPASDGAADENKAIALELARQLAAIGADPLLALEAGTFAPGQPSDPTGKGNSCDTENDDPGCIFSGRLLVLDATPDEIRAAVADVSQTFTGTGAISATHVDFSGLPVAKATGGAATDVAATSACAAAAAPAATTAATSPAASSSSAGAAPVDAAAATGTTNVQAFSGTLGGAPPPVVSTTGTRPFEVQGDSFVGQGAAVQRSCAIQHNACANAANSGQIDASVSDCDAQESACRASNNVARRSLMLAQVHARSLARRQAGAGGFGSCSDPSIAFSDQLPDRQGPGFIANNLDDFNHGSALNIGVIAGFICQRLKDSCKAGEDVVSNCLAAQAAAQAAPQDQAAADAFNNGLGVGGGKGTAAAAADATEPAATTATQCS